MKLTTAKIKELINETLSELSISPVAGYATGQGNLTAPEVSEVPEDLAGWIKAQPVQLEADFENGQWSVNYDEDDVAQGINTLTLPPRWYSEEIDPGRYIILPDSIEG